MKYIFIYILYNLKYFIQKKIYKNYDIIII